MTNGKRDFDEELAQSEREEEEQVSSVLDEIDKQRKRAKREGLNFTAPSKRQLRTKLGRHNSPMIVFQSWTGSAAPGGTINYTVGINNPDPVTVIWLFVHVFVGAANAIRNVGDALATVDPRFPRLTLPDFFGLSIAPSVTTSLNFQLSIPGGIEATNYLGNSFLFRADWHDVGTHFDRGVFIFKVT
jgi:hypothetical protein